METVIVEIVIPALGNSYDFLAPAAGLVRDITAEITRILELTEQNIRFDTDFPMLCHLENRLILDANATLAESSVYDGVRLMLL